MPGTQGQVWFIVGVLTLLSGCATDIGALVAELDERQTDVELVGVPFYAQVTDQCGPAALASVLSDSGISVTAEELKPRVYIPGRKGALQLELIAATRQFGRIPYEIDPSPISIVAELEAGRPVLVLQNLGIRIAPVWHYAVVVGYLAKAQQFVLRSGDNERLVIGAGTFTRTWKRGNYWAIVALGPGELPACADESRYLHSVAATESAGNLNDAASAYKVATEKWPGSSLAWLGLGNAFYADDELLSARDAYQRILGIQPDDAIAMNNLSQVYLQLGCRDDALATIDAALSGVDDNDSVRPHLLLTQKEIQQSDAGMRCLQAADAKDRARVGDRAPAEASSVIQY